MRLSSALLVPKPSLFLVSTSIGIFGLKTIFDRYLQTEIFEKQFIEFGQLIIFSAFSLIFKEKCKKMPQSGMCSKVCASSRFIFFLVIFPTAPMMSAVGKEPHLSFFFSFRGPLLDWFGQIMLYSHWVTQTWRSTNACVPATDEAVYLLNLAMQGLTERCRTQIF